MEAACSKISFVDAHIHLSDEEYSECVNEIVDEAKSSNVIALISNSVDLETSVKSLELAEQYPKIVFAALGIHPWNVNNLGDDELQKTLQLISEQRQNKALIAIGEIGLDNTYAKVLDRQLMVFNEMLRLAEKLGLPVIIHSRGTTTQIIEMLPSYNLQRVLLHWFSNPINALSKVVKERYYISEGLPTAFSNGIREVVRRIPLTNLLTETDGPVRFSKPPFSGKRTTPAFIPTVVKAIAEIKKMNTADVTGQIIRNFEKFFGVKLN
ncbi:MAG: TatD family hydrolase [Candidatus Bathyarchaeota archaeon]|nr:TatD family hydrolase [Candidatus Bathyarchaeota archaeon]MDH5787696.1 TatD family hydrolase [Candidatus Bathyarchaeota archaeon]